MHTEDVASRRMKMKEWLGPGHSNLNHSSGLAYVTFRYVGQTQQKNVFEGGKAEDFISHNSSSMGIPWGSSTLFFLYLLFSTFYTLLITPIKFFVTPLLFLVTLALPHAAAPPRGAARTCGRRASSSLDECDANSGGDGVTPLHRASFLGAIFSMRILLSWAADDYSGSSGGTWAVDEDDNNNYAWALYAQTSDSISANDVWDRGVAGTHGDDPALCRPHSRSSPQPSRPSPFVPPSPPACAHHPHCCHHGRRCRRRRRRRRRRHRRTPHA